MEAIQTAIQTLASKFNPQDVFSSLQTFVGSGYVFLIILGLLAFGIVKKITKILCICAVSFVIWYLFTTGYLDEILVPLNEFLYRVFNGIH